MSLVNWNRLVRSTNCGQKAIRRIPLDRKSTRLNSSHGYISYAVFCLKKKSYNLLDLFPNLRFASLATGSQWMPCMLHQIKRSTPQDPSRFFNEGRAYIACVADAHTN